MADIQIPYIEGTISGSFDYDITNTQNKLSIFTSGLSAGSIVVSYLDASGTKRTLKTYTSDAQDVITISGRQVNVTGTGVTADTLSLSS